MDDPPTPKKHRKNAKGPFPIGTFAICQDCRFRTGETCTNPRAKQNGGGFGLLIYFKRGDAEPKKCSGKWLPGDE